MTLKNSWIQQGRRLLMREKAFRKLLKKHPDVPLRRLPRVNLFDSLTHAIVSQQLSGRVATVIYNRVRALFPRKRLDPKRFLRLKDQMLLIFKLGRPDVFPHADLGVQKGFERLFKLKEKPTAKFILEHSERWKPYRTWAAWYLWRATEE